MAVLPADNPVTAPVTGFTEAWNGFPLLQVPPAGAETMVAVFPVQIDVTPPGIEGSGLTVTVVVLIPVKPFPSVIVTVYTVVTEGAATTAVPAVELSPVEGAHE